jgi:hypothetical protein
VAAAEEEQGEGWEEEEEEEEEGEMVKRRTSGQRVHVRVLLARLAIVFIWMRPTA